MNMRGKMYLDEVKMHVNGMTYKKMSLEIGKSVQTARNRVLGTLRRLHIDMRLHEQGIDGQAIWSAKHNSDMWLKVIQDYEAGVVMYKKLDPIKGNQLITALTVDDIRKIIREEISQAKK